MQLVRVAILCLTIPWILVDMAFAQSEDQWPDETECRDNPPIGELIQGWCLTIDREKGNCLACHTLNIKPWPATLPVAGNIAPPLVAMGRRFPDPEVLRKQIADAPALNPNTTMPPYRAHSILTESEIEMILQFVLSL